MARLASFVVLAALIALATAQGLNETNDNCNKCGSAMYVDIATCLFPSPYLCRPFPFPFPSSDTVPIFS